MDRVGTMLAEAGSLEIEALGPGPEPAAQDEPRGPEPDLADREWDDWIDDVTDEPDEEALGAATGEDPAPEAEKAEADMTAKSRAPGGVEQAFVDLEKQVAKARAATESERAAAEKRARDRESELRSEIETLSTKHRDLEESLEDLEASMKVLEEKIRAKEEKIREEKERLDADRRKLEQEVKDAYRERDEALVLISSLTRRLNTPGLED